MFILLITMTMTANTDNLAPGQQTRTLEVDGRERRYIAYLPEKKDDSKRPVVLVFHGGGSTAEQMIRFSGMNDKADEAGFIAVYPVGTGLLKNVLTFNGGNCCWYAVRRKVDDVKFVDQLLDDLSAVAAIDERRIYATGMSNGAIMCYRLASELSERIAAIAPVAGPMGADACSPSRPVPVCHFHGTDDEFAAYEGGPGKRSRTQTDFYSVKHSIDAWRKANGCTRTRKDVLPVEVEDGTSVVKTSYTGGKGGAEVVLYTIKGGGHTWPGRAAILRYLGKSTKNLSANDVMWEFFQRHARK